jgi:hypothetical protein
MVGRVVWILSGVLCLLWGAAAMACGSPVVAAIGVACFFLASIGGLLAEILAVLRARD